MSTSKHEESTPTSPSGTIAARGEVGSRPDLADTAESARIGTVDVRATADLARDALSETLPAVPPERASDAGDATQSGVLPESMPTAISASSPYGARSSSRSAESFVSGPHTLVAERGMLDHYRIDAKLGAGGMAVVYRAEDTTLKRWVALKILHDHIAGRAENRERFEREARAVARLKHKNIMSVYGFSSPSAPVGYLVAELIEGETLREFVERRGFALPEVAAMVCLRLADALQHAHEAGVIHRDFKPENVMIVSATGVPKLMDFGLARLLDHTTVTMTGAVLGSPAHMSPEAIEGKPVDARVDVFAFGTVLYYAATGRLPFEGSNPAVLLNAILIGKYADPAMIQPRVGGRLGRIIDRCLETDPNDRYQTAAALASDLRTWLGELGYDDVDAELAAFFADPDGREPVLEAELISTLQRLASQTAEEGRMASALAHCDQLLALEPENATALRILGRVKSRRRNRRVAGVLTLIAGLVCSIVLVRPSGTPITPLVSPDAPAATAVSQGVGLVEGASEQALALVLAAQTQAAIERARVLVWTAVAHAQAVHAARTVRVVAEQIAYREAATRASQITPPVRRPTAEELAEIRARAEQPEVVPEPDGPGEVVVVPTRHVDFNVFPPTAMIRIDGVEMGRAADLNRRGLELPLGAHRIEINVPNSQRARLQERFVVRASGATRVALRVPWAPGYVEVNSALPGRVLFEGRAYATGERIEVPIEGDATERRVELQLLPPEGQGGPTSMTVTVRTEQTVPVSAPF